MLEVRKLLVQVEEIRQAGGRPAAQQPLLRVVAAAVIPNPYAGRAWSSDLSELVQPSGELGELLGRRASEALGAPVEGYGKAAIVGFGGEQEHAVACLTSTFGDAFRAAIGGGKAWIPSATKLGGPGTSIDVPTAYRNALWVRSHYDTATLAVADAPLPGEILVAVAVTSGARLHARLGGLALADVKGEDGLR